MGICKLTRTRPVSAAIGVDAKAIMATKNALAGGVEGLMTTALGIKFRGGVTGSPGAGPKRDSATPMVGALLARLGRVTGCTSPGRISVLLVADQYQSGSLRPTL